MDPALPGSDVNSTLLCSLLPKMIGGPSMFFIFYNSNIFNFSRDESVILGHDCDRIVHLYPELCRGGPCRQHHHHGPHRPGAQVSAISIDPCLFGLTVFRTTLHWVESYF